MATNQQLHNTLNSFLDTNSPKLATFLTRKINQQQNAVTYKELREAIFAGQLDYSYLTQWQQDYSQFVYQHYAPLAEKAIQTSASALLSSYGGNLFDPQSTAIENFIKTQGGKLIKEISTAQYNAINVLVRQASMSDTMTVDQLARAIRPCIGLTQRQSQAVKHYYDNLIDQGYSHKDALKKQALYAEKMHRYRAGMIAETELAFAYNAGADAVVRENIQQGNYEPGVTKKWLTADDERVCKECGKIDEEEVGIDETFSNGVMLPPAHPLCRCTIAYSNIILTQQAFNQPASAPQNAQPQQQPDPNYQPPEIPQDYDISGLDYSGNLYLGGSGEMHLMTDPNTGEEYIFKPAKSKNGKPEAFRAYVQEAGYKVQNIVDPDSAVKVGIGDKHIPGKDNVFGAAQQKITNLDKSFDLQEWQKVGGPLDPDVVSQLQREHVTDWLLGNYDSHGRNFILTTDGKLIGVDKEQAFRYITQTGAQSMSYSYHPNSYIGEVEPVYNTLFRRFAHNEIDIDLNNTLAYIKRIETIPDAEYREIFRGYAESLHGKGNKAEQLLDQIVGRKKSLRATYETFYGELLTERSGQKTTFQFVDNVASAAKPLQAKVLSASTLSKMSTPDLHTMAKQMGIKYQGYMTKQQLIDAISDPTKTAQIVQDAKNKAYGIGVTPKKPKPAQAASAAPAVPVKPQQAAQAGKTFGGVGQLSDALNDIDGTLQGASPRGVGLISDASALEGMEVNLRKVTIDGQEYYELSGKLTSDKWAQTLNNMASQQRGSNWHWNQVKGTIDYTKPVLDLTSTTQTYTVSTRYIRSGNDILIVAGSDADSGARALMGQFNIRVQATNGADAARQIQALMQQAGISDIADDVTDAALARYKKMRVIWQTDPAAATRLNVATATDKQIDDTLQRLGITQKRLDKIEVRKVTDGYWTLYDPENVVLAAKNDVAYLYHEAGSLDAAANVLKSNELLATNHRWNRGIVASGASSATDVGTGGADSVFTRIVHDNDIANGRERYKSFGDYVFVFDKKTLERTDWYAYNWDEFGTTEGSTFINRPGAEAFMQRTNQSYSRSNEVLFRNVLPMDTLKEVRVPASDVKPLIDRLKQSGITEINGIKIEKLIKKGGRKV